MENHIFRVPLKDSHELEFFVCGTNELKPFRETRELGIYVLKDKLQLDGGLDEVQLDSFINYLEHCRRYIRSFNENSKPKDIEQNPELLK